METEQNSFLNICKEEDGLLLECNATDRMNAKEKKVWIYFLPFQHIKPHSNTACKLSDQGTFPMVAAFPRLQCFLQNVQLFLPCLRFFFLFCYSED